MLPGYLTQNAIKHDVVHPAVLNAVDKMQLEMQRCLLSETCMWG